jgi:hypothetical protein
MGYTHVERRIRNSLVAPLLGADARPSDGDVGFQALPLGALVRVQADDTARAGRGGCS